jgi:hypothetical protein
MANKRLVGCWGRENRIMRPEQRVVTSLPLQALFDAAGNVAARRVASVGAKHIEELLRHEPRRFVFANVGEPLTWTTVAMCFETWKHEVKGHLAEPGSRPVREGFPGAYLYFSSVWRLETCEEVVVLEKDH